MPDDASGRYAKRITKVIDYIEGHLDEELRVERLARIASFSPFHFHRQFTAYTGVPVARLVSLLRLQRASLELAFDPRARVTDIAARAGFANTESFSRAFRREVGQTPTGFRKSPRWAAWQVRLALSRAKEHRDMQVELIDFPETLVAALEHRGPERLVYETTKKFIEWRRSCGIGPQQGDTYGVHYSDPDSTPDEEYRLDLCVTVDEPVAPNAHGVVTKVIPAGRCAKVRHLGSRHDITAARWLYREWLPASGEELRDFPVFFHYVNVGPDVQPAEMITDVYLPLR